MSDIVVIGGGIVGSGAAYYLARQGATVTLVDRADTGLATAAGAGIVAPGVTPRELGVISPLMDAAVSYYAELLPQLAEDGETETGDAVVGSLVVATNDDEVARLKQLEDAISGRVAAGTPNVGDVTWLATRQAQSLFPPLGPVAAALHASGSARVDGRLMRTALQQAARRRGATIVHGDAALKQTGNRVTVEVDGGAIPNDAVILAAGAWSGRLAEQIGATVPVFPQRGQILHMDLPDVETSSWPIVLGFHSHYMLTFPTRRVVAGATRENGSGFNTSTTTGGIHEVTSEALRIAPGLASGVIHEIRVGLRPASPDGLPIMGRLPGTDNLYVSTGHGPSGLQLGPYSGMAVAELALGRDPAIDLSALDPERFH